MKELQSLIISKPYLAWYVKDPSLLSEESIVEHILNYGTWDDYTETEKLLGINKIKIIFETLKNKRRCNLRPQTVKYFTNYYTKYA